MLRDRTLLRAGRLVELLAERGERLAHLHGGDRDGLELARGELAVVANRRVADELADLLRVFGRDLAGHLDEEAADEGAGVLQRRLPLLLGPVVQTTHPEVVVLVEAPLLALGEIVAPACKAVLESGERLLTVDADALGLGPDLVLEVGQIALALLDVHRGDDRRREVENLLELTRCDVEQVADPARNALEEPDVRDRSGQVDVAHPLAADLLAGHLDAAALADDALVADALVLAAVALPVLRRTEDALAEESVTLRLERAVVDRFGLRYLAGRPIADLLARGKPDLDGIEIVDVDQRGAPSSLSPRSRRRPGLPAGRLPVPLPRAPLPPASPRRPKGRQATLRWAARARRPGRPAPGPPRPPRPWAAVPRRGASRATGRCRAPRPPAGARRPPRGPRPYGPHQRGRARRARATASPSGAP